jgi:hypothetical protein
MMSTRVRRRQKLGVDKILASTKVLHRQNIDVNKSPAEHLLTVLVRQSPQANKLVLSVTGVVDTGKKFISVSLTPVNNFSSVDNSEKI